MPGHKTHERVGLLCTPLLFPLTQWLHLSIDQSIFFSITYLVANYFITPDLDTDSMPYHRWGLFRIFWWPYKRYIPHRSWLSHSSIISGTLRFLYLLLPFVVGMLWIPVHDPLRFLPYIGILWMSIILVDTLHVVLDSCFSDRHRI